MCIVYRTLITRGLYKGERKKERKKGRKEGRIVKWKDRKNV